MELSVKLRLIVVFLYVVVGVLVGVCTTGALPREVARSHRNGLAGEKRCGRSDVALTKVNRVFYKII